MTVTLSLTPDQERFLNDAAQARGVDTSVLLDELVRKAVDEWSAHPPANSKRKDPNAGVEQPSSDRVDSLRRAHDFYDTELGEEFETAHRGENVAIHPDTRDYGFVR
ncbi:MAG: hypothetical protein ACLQVD_19850 [Capsulimonadaceae bacterium]